MLPYLNYLMGAIVAFCAVYAVRALLNWRNDGEEELNGAIGVALAPSYILLKGTLPETLLVAVLFVGMAVILAWRFQLRRAKRRSHPTRT